MKIMLELLKPNDVPKIAGILADAGYIVSVADGHRKNDFAECKQIIVQDTSRGAGLTLLADGHGADGGDNE